MCDGYVRLDAVHPGQFSTCRRLLLLLLDLLLLDVNLAAEHRPTQMGQGGGRHPCTDAGRIFSHWVICTLELVGKYT